MSIYNRGYSQFCPVAYALEVVGERWTLLVIRELLVGPRRFKDLMDGLPGISTNLLTERLKSLEVYGIVERRVLPPPAGSTVYELTTSGKALESAVVELGRWGAHLLPPSLEGIAEPSVGSIALGMKGFFRPEQAKARKLNETYEWHLGNEVVQARVSGDCIEVQQGNAGKADAVFYTDIPVYLGLFSGQISPEQAIGGGLIRIEGDKRALSRFLSVCGLPTRQ